MEVKANSLKASFELHKQEFIEAATQVLESGWYVLGPKVKEFEVQFAQYTNANYCVGVASGLDALILAFDALNLPKGSEVIAPANTYIASIMGFTKVGLVPRFVEPDCYYNLDATKIEAAINEKTKAICVVHLYGQIANMDKIMEIANKYNLKVVEDCAQAHGAKLNGKQVGTFGDIGCFSFYPTKNVGAFGDAGCVITNNEAYANQISCLRNYGSSKHYYFDTVGYNSRLDELQASLLSVRLKYIDETIANRHHIAELYDQGITNECIVKPENWCGKEGHVYHQYVVRVKNRNHFMNYLKEHGIGSQIHYPQPPHLSDAYRYLGYKVGDFPITEMFANQVVSLPIYEGLDDDSINFVINVINAYKN